MSASLVGSEMCIRDSAPPCGTHLAGRAAATRGAPHRAEGRKGRTPRERAVSYTHLTLPTICSV
eukprot:8647161-Alexandrium_andersonii.AAC.1